MTEKALVLFSGGQDSTTCLAKALPDYNGAITTIGFDYGQRHAVELEQAKIIANLAGVPFTIIDMTLLSKLTQNALTRNTIPIESKDGELPNTFVDGRNHMFISVAAIYAKQQGISHLITGVCETDYSGYPDCRQDFIHSLNHTLNLAMDTSFVIHTPLMHLTKAETVLLMDSLGRLDWY